jgi:uncharacterized protein with HEPN domain
LKDSKVFLKHIIDEISYIIKETKLLSFDDLLKNETLKRALTRSLEVIGEASKNISDDFKKAHPEIEWRELAGLRDKLIHFYFGVDWKVVWDVVKNKIPALKDKIAKLLQ